ncbi:MAG: hypothetical protein CMH53_10165 [Myxococcales bacterium]|nr:hypothetical protein [Myxococcales bacterium]
MRRFVSMSVCLVLMLAAGCGSEQEKNSKSAAADASAQDILADSSAADTSAQCPGAPGCPCGSDAPCDADSQCLERAEGSRCALACESEACPSGLNCAEISQGGESLKVCIDRSARLCSPCRSNQDCVHPGAPDGRCLDLGPAGTVCGSSCASDDDCPSGYGCSEATDLEGKSAKQCQAIAADGGAAACTCTANAVSLALEGTCTATLGDESKPLSCLGTSQCKEAGKAAACVSAGPTDESCDGVDNDCDGQTDEQSCDDSNPCTTDSCDAAKGCQFAPNTDPCDADGSVCTVKDTCDSGACKAGSALDCDDGNPCTTDSCDAAQGCQHPSVTNETECAADGSKYCLVGKCIDKLKCPADCKSPGSIIATKQEDKLVAADGAEYDAAGLAVSIFGDLAAVGANGDGGGSVTIYARQQDGSWASTTKVVGSDTAGADSFGCSVVINGDRLVVGACGDDDKGASSGSVYIFKRQGKGSWTQVAKLVAADGEVSGRFGKAVDLSGDRLLVGAYGASPKAKSSGAAYIFEAQSITKWKQMDKLVPADGKAYDNFGKAVSLSGNRVVVGAAGVDDKGDGSGAAYVFERQPTGTWSEVGKLIPASNAAGDSFGASVAIDGDRLIAGAESADTKAQYAGAAFIYERQSDGKWTEASKLVASDGVKASACGTSVALSGNRALVGCDNDATFGAVYLYSRQKDGLWAEGTKITTADGAKSDYFGVSVSMSANRILVGAFGDDDKGTSSGSAYVFDLGQYSCTNPGSCTCKAGFSGPDCSIKAP